MTHRFDKRLRAADPGPPLLGLRAVGRAGTRRDRLSPFAKRLFFVLACAAIGFFVAASMAPRGGARYGFGWSDDFLGLPGFTLGAVGAGVGLVIGLVLAARQKWRGTKAAGESGPEGETGLEGGDGPSPKRRWFLRKRRRRDAPKRFGRRGR